MQPLKNSLTSIKLLPLQSSPLIGNGFPCGYTIAHQITMNGAGRAIFAPPTPGSRLRRNYIHLLLVAARVLEVGVLC